MKIFGSQFSTNIDFIPFLKQKFVIYFLLILLKSKAQTFKLTLRFSLC